MDEQVNIFDQMMDDSYIKNDYFLQESSLLPSLNIADIDDEDQLLPLEKDITSSNSPTRASTNEDLLNINLSASTSPEEHEQLDSGNKNNANNINDIPDAKGKTTERKKAQNRAAQKAFRLRKDARMKELEIKVTESERIRNKLYKEVEELRHSALEIQRTNRQLLLQSEQHKDCVNKNNNKESLKNDNYTNGSNINNIDGNNKKKYSFPTEDEFFDELVSGNRHGPNPIRTNKQYDGDMGEKLYTIPATWEYLLKLADGGYDFDVSLVMNSLKGSEVCHGYGPAYKKKMIDDVVKDSLQH